MGQSPIFPHFPPLAATIGTQAAQVNVKREKFSCGYRHLPSGRRVGFRSPRRPKINALQTTVCAFTQECPGQSGDVAPEWCESPGGSHQASLWRLLLLFRARIRAGHRAPGAQKRESADKPGFVVDNHSSGTHVAVRLKRPTRKHARAARCSFELPASLFGLAPSGVCRAVPVTRTAVRSYRTLSPLPACRLAPADVGGLLSVALSVGSRPPGVTWRPALRSPDFPHPTSPASMPGGVPGAIA